MMKGTGKIIGTISILTTLVLFYVHGNIALLKISYQIDEKNERLAERSETYRHLKFEVEQMKAPRLLESRLKEMPLDLTLPQEVQVVRVPVSESITDPLLETSALDATSNRLMRFVNRWIGIAQAKTDN